MSDVILVRHVSTPGNAPEKGQPKLHRGVADIQPSPEGIEQSTMLASKLAQQNPNIVEIYSAPLTRTLLMAKEISAAVSRIGQGQRIPVHSVDEANTWNTGLLAGRPMDEVKPILKAYAGEKRTERWPAMKETFETFLVRWLGFLSKLLDHPHPGEIVVCTQGTNIGTALEWDHAGRPPDVRHLDFEYGRVETVKPAHWVKLHEDSGHSDVRGPTGKVAATAAEIS